MCIRDRDKDRNLAIQALREVEDKSPNGIAMDLERNLPVIPSNTEDTEDKQEEVLTQARYFFFFCAHVEIVIDHLQEGPFWQIGFDNC